MAGKDQVAIARQAAQKLQRRPAQVHRPRASLRGRQPPDAGVEVDRRLSGVERLAGLAAGQQDERGLCQRTLEQIEDEVLRLPGESRARLIERLLASFQVQAGSDAEGIAIAWAEEAQRRDDEMSSGSEKGVPAEEVFSKLRSRR